PADVVADSPNAADYEAWNKAGVLELTQGNVADYDRIMEDVRAASKQFRLKEVGFDPWQATHFASTLFAKSIQMVKVPQNTQQLSEPMKALEMLVRSKRLAHGNNPMLDWNVGNTVAKEDVRGNIYPNKQSTDAKIDGVLAILNAANRAFAALTNSGLLDEWLNHSNPSAN